MTRQTDTRLTASFAG